MHEHIKLGAYPTITPPKPQTKLPLQQPVGTTLTSTAFISVYTSIGNQMSNADEDTLQATSIDVADESE